MKLTKLNFFLGVLLVGLFVTSCNDKDDDPTTSVDNFNRSEMLSFWADDIIIPAYESFDGTLDNFVEAKDAFANDQSIDHLENLKATWLISYKSWQNVAMFDIGKAEEINFLYSMNIFPADVDLIEENISNGDYNLTLPSNMDAQGFPAIEYLLFGMDDSIVPLDLLSEPNRIAYISDLVDRMKSLNSEVLNDWKTNFRNTFVENNGSSATASTDKMINDFLFHFEKHFRAGKIGIPAGVFSGSELSSLAEAPYSGKSKELFFASFDAIQNFFTGLSFDKSTTGLSLQQYLSNIAQTNESQDISIAILQQWESATTSAQHLMDNFKDQVEQDNSKMLNTYDEIQKSVVLLKVDMMQALNIQVDYVDADGD